MTHFHCRFNISSGMVTTTDDNQILEPSGNKEFICIDKSNVACTQKSFPGHTPLPPSKRYLSLFSTLPISLRNAWASNPDLTRLTPLAGNACLRMDDEQLLILHWLSTSDQQARGFRC